MARLILPGITPNEAHLGNVLSRLLPLTTKLESDYEKAVSVQIKRIATENALFEENPFFLYVNMNGFWKFAFGNLDILAIRREFAEWLCTNADNSFSMLPHTLLNASLERLFLPFVDTISRVTGLPAVFVGAPRTGTREIFSEHMDFVLECGPSIRTPVRVSWQDTATLVPVLEKLETMPQNTMLSSEFFKARLRAKMCIGSMRLTYEEILSLMQGDVLLPETITPSNPHIFIFPNLSLACTLDGTTLTIDALETLTDGASPMSQDENNQPLLNADDLKNMELEISFELPQLRLPLQDCAKLVQGYTLTLPVSVEQATVSVLAGGHKIALGKLVDVGGQLGVQIIEMKAGSAEGQS